VHPGISKEQSSKGTAISDGENSGCRQGKQKTEADHGLARINADKNNPIQSLVI
jgi:hypothetical protein